MLILHIRNLEDGAIAKRIYEEQKEKNWPGLVTETDEICKELKIESVNTTNQSKKEEVLAQEKRPDIPDCFNIFCASIIDLGMGKSLFRIREPGYTDENYEDILFVAAEKFHFSQP